MFDVVCLAPRDRLELAGHSFREVYVPEASSCMIDASFLELLS